MIVAYSAVRNNSNDTAIMADLCNLSAKIKVFESDNNIAPVSATNLASLNWQANRDAYQANGTSVTRNVIYCYSGSSESDNRYWQCWR